MVPLVLMAAGEGGLRWAGFGYPTAFFVRRQVNDSACVTDNQAFGRRFFPPGLVRYPWSVTLPAVKGPVAVRLFVLGESAAMGDPDPKFGLARMVEVLLRERCPERKIEVVNAAMVAINSHVVVPIARDCARQQGNLWVVYMGNNEMIGPYGSLSAFGSQTPPLALVRATLALKSTRVGQLADAGLYLLRHLNQPPAEWGGMTMWAHLGIRQDDPRTARVYQHFAANLSRILEIAHGAGVPVLLCTVGTNVKDCAPFGSLHLVGLTSAELADWDAAYGLGKEHEAQGNFAEALACYERAARLDGQFADLSFRRAGCCLELGRVSEAGRFFRQARDQDALQFRADSRVNQIIRQSAAARANRGVRLLDAEALLAAASPRGLAGRECFYEHVHLNPEGNYLLARAVAERAASALSLESGPRAQPSRVEADSSREPLRPSATNRMWLSRTDCLRELGFVEWNRHDLLAQMLQRVELPPFVSQLNHTQHVQDLRVQLERSRPATKPVQVARAAAEVAAAVAGRPADADLRWNLAQLFQVAGNARAAEEQWRAVIRLWPQGHLPYYNLANLLETTGRDAEAGPLLSECLRLHPDSFKVRFALGGWLVRQGRFKEALHHLRWAVRQRPGSVEARLALGLALAQAKQPAAASRELRQVLALDPQNIQARQQLGAVQGAP